MFRIGERLLEEECRKLIARQERYMREMRNDDDRRERREVKPHEARLLRPPYWQIDPSFNPYHVRRNKKSIVRAINLALNKDDYRPNNPLAHEVLKRDGETRTVSVFPIADSLVSRNLYLSLMEKNRTLLSARSYAYRSDLSSHDAIQYISSEFSGSSRLFLAEFDFSKYFDSISHDYIWKVLDEHHFLTTPQERFLIAGFLNSKLRNPNLYTTKSPPDDSKVGLPQGTSISLFLANIAAWEMDRALERIGVGFVRYADDTLIWSKDYSQICDAANILVEKSADIGAKINHGKSHGIRIFTPNGQKAEMESTSKVEFVGYRFSGGKVGLRGDVVNRIKGRIQYLIWSNLLEALQSGTFRRERIYHPLDRDYRVMLLQIRHYLYGGLDEKKVRQLQRGTVRRIRFPGVLSYFPLINDIKQQQDLDGWLLAKIQEALKKRAIYLGELGIERLPLPHGLPKTGLLNYHGTTSHGSVIDLRVPSIVRLSGVIYRAASTFGANRVANTADAVEYDY